jgi:hypothetical protein
MEAVLTSLRKKRKFAVERVNILPIHTYILTVILLLDVVSSKK